MDNPILQVRDLCKVYGSSGNQVIALDHVSLTVNRGEFVSIVGPSGSGKSTLLHILGGVDKPTSGSVQVDGVELSALDESRLAVFRRRQIGLIYQFYNLIPVLTVQENLTLPLLLDHRKAGKGQVKAMAEELGLSDRLNALPGELSGGQQQSIGGRCSPAPPWCWPTSPPATWTPRTAPPLWSCSRPSTRNTPRPSSSSPTTPTLPGRPGAWSALRTAAS